MFVNVKKNGALLNLRELPKGRCRGGDKLKATDYGNNYGTNAAKMNNVTQSGRITAISEVTETDCAAYDVSSVSCSAMAVVWQGRGIAQVCPES